MSETTQPLNTASDIQHDIHETSFPLKLRIDLNCFREAAIFSPSNTIQLLSRHPEYEHDDHRAFMRAIGTTQNYRYATEGSFIVSENSAKLIYTEDPSLGLSGDTVALHFARSPEKRSSLMIERSLNQQKLFFAKGQTINYLTIAGIRTEICTITKKHFNTLTENGGKLILDYELLSFGMSMLRTRIEINADKPEKSTAEETTETPLFYIAGKI